MSFIKFYSTNLVTQSSTTFTASSEDAFFPATNLKLPQTTKVFRSESGTATASIIMDFQSTETINSLLVAGSSTDGLGFNGDITLDLNATSNFTSPAFTTTLTPSTKFNFGVKTFADQNYRYARVTATGTSFLELSKIFIGQYTQLSTNNIDFGWRYENRDNSQFRRNRYSQRFVDRINDITKITASFRFLNKSEFDTISDLFDVHGESIPLWIVVDEDQNIVNDKERFAGYFYFDRRPSFSNSGPSLYNTSFSVEAAT